ncbi:hypothetical protein FRC06_007876 [Ceratobasidium sp. 370]|nr:hypothetical protein FRC06_007876 [Ceratobasidium sp. 370]
MIIIDDQKFACSACINGHRSSSCHHTERPLFEIKKKGRPVTQCERCRELRKTRSYHSKCLCDKLATVAEPTPSTDKTPGNKRKKALRAAPKVPALPNGIRDILDANKSSDLEEQEEARKRSADVEMVAPVLDAPNIAEQSLRQPQSPQVTTAAPTGGTSVSDDSSIESLLARAIAKLPPPPPGKLSVFQSATGVDRIALVVLPRLGTAGGSSCCAGSSVAVSEGSSGNVFTEPSALFPPFPQLNRAKNPARLRRQIRSPSPSDDELTDADAEGEIDPDNESAEPTAETVANNDWALTQLDIDVDLELELAADAIDCVH